MSSTVEGGFVLFLYYEYATPALSVGSFRPLLGRKGVLLNFERNFPQ